VQGNRAKDTKGVLKEIIYKRFDSESAMARALGWPRQRLNKITKGLREPSLHEVGAMANALSMSFEKMAYIFLPESHHMSN